MRAAAAVALAALALSPAAAGAAQPLPVGSAHGVRIEQGRSGATLVFGESAEARRLWRQVAGRWVDVSCAKAEGLVGLFDDGHGGGFRVARTRRSLRLGRIARGSDWCTVWRRGESRGRLTVTPLVAIPLTQAGAVALDEREQASLMSGVLLFAGELGDGLRPNRYPSAQQLNESLYDAVPRRIQVVPLAAATDTPPAGRVGWWSDGGQSAAVVTLSAVGRRLYIEVGPDDLLRTNLARTFFLG